MLGIEDLRRAEVVGVAGEAAAVTFTIAGSRGDGWAITLNDAALARLFEKEFRKRLSSSYSVEELRVDAGARTLSFRVFGNGSFPKESGSGSVGTRPKSWVLEVAEAVEGCRRHIHSRLRAVERSASVHASWVPGRDARVLRSPIDPQAPDTTLLEVLRELRTSELLLNRRTILVGSAALLAVLLGSIGFLAADDRAAPAALLYAYIALYGIASSAIALAWRSDVRSKRQEIRDLTTQRELREVLGEAERRAYKVFQVNEAQLRRYYAQALRQGSAVFLLGVACIAAGFGAIIAAFVFISHSDTGKVGDKVVIAVLGGAGSVMSNFIAVLFLRMYKGATDSLTVFHDRMVLTHHVHFGTVLTAKIEDSHLRDATLAAMAKALTTREPVAGDTRAPRDSSPDGEVPISG